MDSHTGLRGAAAVYIALFHGITFSELKTDFQGSSIMPLFFMLSGFSLVVAYGHKFPDPNVSDDNKQFPRNAFYWNRWVRTMPTYYLVNALALLPYFYGYTGMAPWHLQGVFSSWIGQITVTVIPVSTWFGGIFSLPVDGPSWTISTLLMMWIIFPFSMPGIKKKTDQ
jgi:peptidoglycan/LPS O-acetylase OafA/YrhL